MFLVIVRGVVFMKRRCVLYNHQNPKTRISHLLRVTFDTRCIRAAWCGVQHGTSGANSPMSRCFNYYCNDMAK